MTFTKIKIQYSYLKTFIFEIFIFNWIQCVWKYNHLFWFQYEWQNINGIRILDIFQRSEQNFKFVKSQNICINVDFLLKNILMLMCQNPKKNPHNYWMAKEKQEALNHLSNSYRQWTKQICSLLSACFLLPMFCLM